MISILPAGSGIAIAAAMTASTTVSHFSLSASGKIVALYAAMYALGKVFFIYLLELGFEEDDNLGGFFMTSGICFLVLMIFSAVFHRPKLAKKSEELSLVTKGNDVLEARNTQTIVPLKHIINSLKGSSLFHLTFWPAVLIYSCSVTIMNNLTTIVPEDHTKPSTIITVFSVANAVVRILVGMVMDTSGFVSVRRKLYLKVGFSAFFLAVMAMYTIGIDIDDLSVPFAIGAGMSVGALFVIPVAMLTYTFGKAYYSFTFGLFLGTAAVCVLIIQVIAGVIYDSCEDGFLQYPIKENCFFWPFILIINIAAVTICAIIGNIYYQSSRPSRTTDGFPQESDISGSNNRSGYISFDDGAEDDGIDTGKHSGTGDSLMANGSGKHNGSATMANGTVSGNTDTNGAVAENGSLKSNGTIPDATSNGSADGKVASGLSVSDPGGKGDNQVGNKNNFSNVALD